MAAPSVDIAGQVAPMTSRISSEPLLLAAVVVVITASLAMVASWIVYKLLTERDKAFKALAVELNTLSTCVAKVIEIQGLDHAGTLKNRDLLADVREWLSKIDERMTTMFLDIRKTGENLQLHAKDCADKLHKKEQL